MMQIVVGAERPNLLPGLLAIFEEQWGNLESPLVGDLVPSPLLALNERDELIGGLSFTTAPAPHDESTAVWINAVIVVPEHRRQGLATKLIKRASEMAKELGVGVLYVLTDVPALYTALGWKEVHADGTSSVLAKALGELR
ncbi:MAG: GNAT family N-acetyltransferase [Gammaproteobacteria bacterium]|nr:GNAT family N-acetyltransferase [Gammaproteobacteria bacterium]